MQNVIDISAHETNGLLTPGYGAKRPKDECFSSLAALESTARLRAQLSRAFVTTTREIRPVAIFPNGNDENRIGRIQLVAPVSGTNSTIVVEPSHYSFGQIVGSANGDCAFMRQAGMRKLLRKPGGADLTEMMLWYGLQQMARTTDVQMYSQRTTGSPDAPAAYRVMRSLNGANYGRIFDHEIAAKLQEHLHVTDGAWGAPVEFLNGPTQTSFYSNDRGSWMFLVDRENTIEINGDTYHRGVLVYNSEVGNKSFGIVVFLYRSCCANRMFFGVIGKTELRIRHNVSAPERFQSDFVPMLREFSQADPSGIVDRLKRAQDTRIGQSTDDVQDWLRRNNYTQRIARAIINRAEEEEGEARTVYQVIQGATALARDIPHQDIRVDAEMKAGRLLVAGLPKAA